MLRSGARVTKGFAAVEDLDRQFRPALLAYFVKRLKDWGEAEDLTQEVFVRLANHPDRHSGRSIHAYVFTIAANLLKDRAKSPTTMRWRQCQNIEQFGEKFRVPPELAEGLTPERVLIAKDSLKEVLGVLLELNERTRDIYILSRLENMQYRDIATLQGISVSAVEKHIMKAAAHLAARFLP
jgi:RNA polymerase sigma factor (sigma-70 family)